MLTYLITGISGFVAGHYIEYISKNRPDSKIVGIDEGPFAPDFMDKRAKIAIEFHKLSLQDTSGLESLIKEARPDYIVHLASFSSVAFSWTAPVPCFVNNTNIFLNVVETVRKLNLKPRILSVGSSEEYGVVRKEDIPLKEEARLNPINPYAVSRVSQEMVSLLYARGYGIPVICTRSFNHIGPRQLDKFVVSGFARQIVEAKKGKRSKIVCGDLGIIRDFIDVRDVVRAYDLLLENGKSGEIYNICSGKGYALSEILGMLQREAGTEVPVEKDPLLIRPVDNPVIIGSCEKLKRSIAFKQEYDIKIMLRSILDYWDKAIR